MVIPSHFQRLLHEADVLKFGSSQWTIHLVVSKSPFSHCYAMSLHVYAQSNRSTGELRAQSMQTSVRVQFLKENCARSGKALRPVDGLLAARPARLARGPGKQVTKENRKQRMIRNVIVWEVLTRFGLASISKGILRKLMGEILGG